MKLSDYDYSLPESLIAQKAIIPRDSCKLMVLGNHENISHKKFHDISDYFKSEDVLVLNDTKVEHSKLVGKKDSGSRAELILLKKISENIYEAKVKTKNPHIGTKILFKKGHAIIISQKNIDTFIVKLSDPSVLKDAILPTPPYIMRKVSDREYQTAFSRNPGSLASPTAGLHFTRSLLKKIEKKGVKIVYITLHVSYGTFKNIDDMKTYIMDPERYYIPKSTADAINDRKGRLFVCGTTTLKTLETAADNDGKIPGGRGESTLFIYPPFRFKSGADVLITNFHLPKSTLLLLTCAFGGRERILKAYDDAVRDRYRFFSLGDAMIIFTQAD